MRRRKTGAAEREQTPSDEPMDEDDQARLVASLEQEGMQQIENTNRIFTYACTLAISITVMAVALHEGSQVGQWAHAIYSSGIHWLARFHATTIPTRQAQPPLQSNSVALLIFLVLSPLLLVAASAANSNEADTATLHWSFALANLIVAICSILLRYESINTIKALEVLEGSKYSYKSL